ncbi:MAG: type II secretion system secretin GspD [Moraxellaceae bacterium]|nr:type II secretion system secretin GspD [Moraxellaceae bacterium]
MKLHQLIKPLLIATPIWLASQGLAYAGSWKVNLQDADIHAFINEVANITKSNFVPDPRINGKVTVISNRPMNEDEIYQLFLSVMQVNGIVAIEKNGIVELKPDNFGKQSGLPVDLSGKITGEDMITRLVYLQNTQASEVLSAIRPLMPQSAHAAAVPSVNALVLSDRANSLNELMVLVNSLDTAGDSTVATIPLRHTDAERMMALISKLISAGDGQASGLASQVKVIADTTSDRLLVSGSPDKIAKIRNMVSQIDTIPNKRLSGMKVFALNYADASHVANILRALLTGSSINSAEQQSSLAKASLSNSKKNSNSSTANAPSPSTPKPSTSINRGSSSTDKYGHHFSIIADETKNSIYINASGQTMAEIEEFIQKIDTAEVQVLIQAAIIEISGDDVQQLGVQWALGNNNSGYGFVNFDNAGVSATGLASAVLAKKAGLGGISKAASTIAGALLGIGNSKTSKNGNTQFYGAILQAIDKTTSANLLSSPSITTLNHKQASLLVGQNVPFVTGSYTSGSSGGSNPFQTVERQDVGIQLNVIPHVGSDGMVKLDVSQEVSSVVKSNTTNINGLVTNKSFINTTVMAKNGQTIALGGLMRENNSNNQQKVPALGDVPFLGRLFRSDGQSNRKSNLIIFLQPTIIRNGGVVPSVTEVDGDKIKVMQLSIDRNGTIKQVPLSGTQGWYGKKVNLTNNQNLMALNPVTSNESIINLPTQQEFFTDYVEPLQNKISKNKSNSAKIREQLKNNSQPINENNEYQPINIHKFQWK